MNVIDYMKGYVYPAVAVNEKAKSEDRSKADRDVLNLINNYVRKGMGFYRPLGNSPFAELIQRTEILSGSDIFKNEVVEKAQSYLRDHYSFIITYDDEELRLAIDMRLGRIAETIQKISHDESLLFQHPTLQSAIMYELKNNS